jgi:hypothetical protein
MNRVETSSVQAPIDKIHTTKLHQFPRVDPQQ